MLHQYLAHIASDTVLLTCSATMACLFLFDLFGLIAHTARMDFMRHIDFKSSIMSIGIFGTFLGILSGLYAFQSGDIVHSVPTLLEGLKFAFATSVFGMFLSVVLSILHKLFGVSADDSNTLKSIDRRIERLDRTILSLAKTIEFPTELVNQFSGMQDFLKRELGQINRSLEEALVQLSKGATEEIIAALKAVITDFNDNLTEQFGDNFKQLNAACLKMVEWQDKYKDHVDTAEKHLTEIRKSLDKATESANSLVKSHEETREICREVGGLIKTYDLQVKTLEQHLASCKKLGEEAKQFLSKTEEALTLSSKNMNSFSEVIEGSVSKQSQSLTQLTEKIEEQLPKSLGELESVLTKLTYQFADDYKSLFEFVVNKNERK